MSTDAGSTRYLDDDGVVVWDDLDTTTGERLYSRFDGRWVACSSEQVAILLRRAVEISPHRARQMIEEQQLRQTGCVNDDRTFDTSFEAEFL